MKDLTNQEMLEALTEWGCELIEDQQFFVRAPGGGTTRLEAEDYDSAVFEAYNLMKP